MKKHIHLVKREGHIHVFDERKVYASCYAACLSAHVAHKEAEKICEKVTKDYKNMCYYDVSHVLKDSKGCENISTGGQLKEECVAHLT